MARDSEYKKGRTLRLSSPNRDWKLVALALCHEAKNLYNITTFLIRQVHSAYEYCAETKSHVLKPNLHQHQIDAIGLFNRVIDEVNEKRKAKITDESKFAPIPRLEQQLQFGPFGSILSKTVIDNAVRSHLDENGQCVYRRLPAVAAQQVVLSVLDLWNASISAQKDYFKHPAKYTGRPRFPSFLAKNDYFPIEFPMSMIVRAIPKPKQLIELNDDISIQLLEQFYEWDIKQAVAEACSGRGWSDFEARHIRIAAEGNTNIRIDLVVHIRQEYPEGSMLHRLYQEHGDALREMKKVKERNEFLIKAIQRHDPTVKAAGIDYGENNVATMSFSTGHRAKVYDGDRFVSMMRDYDQRLDKQVSWLVTPRMKELQAKAAALQEQGQKLSKPERIELRKEFKQLYANPDYKALITRRSRRKNDFEHKLTSDIVQQCVSRGVDVIVIGRNKGWKNELDMGRKNNRSFHGIAHARLTDLIRYKAESHGIAVVTVEESYTSKTSFIDGDELRSYTDKEQQTDAVPEARMSGHRSTKNRNLGLGGFQDYSKLIQLFSLEL